MTQRQQDYDNFQAFRDEVWRQNWIEGERLESEKLWREFEEEGGVSSYLRDAQTALEEARAVQAARNAKLSNRVATAVAESFIDLDI
ncbi:hypothetical protein SynBIOSE41_01989 [Synechococcus sp. BIOS-E4-1]|uniref:hypothetical protein n=1 Tax=Synechococcus sp. BIOS-E4-1 TaxID=1400864 RepID=UPI001647FEE5|nr:hypothetical protein [Synechococcus sp. BIOS-E4-1]QNI54495.1 hypothetical protein SynBIOSE41_01989 [Synechococcus sp. BIOS-E4-1]